MKKLSIVLLLLIVLVAGAVVGVPWLVRDQLTKSLSETLGQTVTIRDLELNPFKGTLLIQAIEIGELTSIGRIDVVMRLGPLFDQRVEIESAEIAEVVLPVSVVDGEVTVADFMLAESGEAEEPQPGESPPWIVVLDKVMVRDWQTMLDLDGVHYNLALASLDVNGFVSDNSQPTEFVVDLAVNEARLNTSGKVSIEEAVTRVSGSVALESLALADYEALIPVDIKGLVEVRGNISVAIGEPLHLAFDGTASIAQLALDGILPDPMTAESAGWQGRLELGIAAGELSELAVTGGANADKILSRSSIEAVAVDGMRVGVGEFDAESVIARQLSIPELGSINSLSLDGLGVSGSNFKAASIKLDNPDVSIIRTPEGAIAGIPEPDPNAEPGEPLTLNIGELKVSGGVVRFSDRFTTPDVELAIKDLNLIAQNISDPGPTTFELTARHADQHDETDTISASGAMSMLSPPVTGNAKFFLSRFDLHQIDPYIGGGITSGRLKLNSEITLAEDLIEAHNDVEIVGIRVDKRAVDRNTSSQEMPISLALSLLKDNDGRINLKVPVSSSRDEFSVDTGHIVQTALGNATRKAALNYAKFALQPFGSLLLAKDVADMLARPRFESVNFESRDVELSKASREYIEKLTKLLLDRPELQISVCGMSTRLDLPPEEDQEEEEEEADESREEAEGGTSLLELAAQRGVAVRKALVAAGVHDERILSCAPDVIDDDSRPRVEISL